MSNHGSSYVVILQIVATPPQMKKIFIVSNSVPYVNNRSLPVTINKEGRQNKENLICSSPVP